MFQSGGFEDRHGCCHTNPIIGTKGGAIGCHPLPVNQDLYGIFFKIEIQVIILLRYHVQVALQHNSLPVFHARSGRLFNNDVSHLIHKGGQPEILPELLHVGNHFGFFFRGPGNLCKCMEVFPYLCRC